MSQFRKLLSSLSIRQRVSIVAIAIAVVAAVVAFAQWQRERDFHPLYSSLAPEDAGTIVQKLREANVDYRFSDNGATVLVPASRIAELRLEMASAGLPKSGRIGFELFDKTNFGMTEFTEHVNYRRALEGELERSIMSLSEVEQARVHLTFPKESVFLESKQDAKASVLLKLRTGAKLSPQNVQAVTNLVASAVEALAPEAVTVLDMRGALLNRPKRNPIGEDSANSEAALEFQQKVERDFVYKINATLEPLLGAGKYHAAVSAECDLTSGEQSEETFDPTKSVMATSQKTEDQQTTSVTEGVPGTASNLPRPAASPAPAPPSNTHRTEQISYQTSRTMRRVKLPQGTLKRISVAILLDQAVRWEGAGANTRRVLVPPAPETVKTIHDVVAAAVGFTAQRGDLLTVETLPFESTLNLEPPGASPQPVKPPTGPLSPIEELKRNPLLLGGVAAGVLVVLAVVGGAIFLMLRGKRRSGAAGMQEQLPHLGERALAGAASGAPGLPMTQPLDMSLVPALAASRVEVLAGQLRAGAPKDSELYASVLRGWLSQENKH
jgi:flagellar M-ring protein FliF